MTANWKPIQRNEAELKKDRYLLCTVLTALVHYICRALRELKTCPPFYSQHTSSLEAQPENSFFLSGPKFRPIHLLSLLFVPISDKKARTHLEFSREKKRLWRQGWNLVSVKIGAIFCLVLKQQGRKKENLKTITKATVKSTLCLPEPSFMTHYILLSQSNQISRRNFWILACMFG